MKSVGRRTLLAAPALTLSGQSAVPLEQSAGPLVLLAANGHGAHLGAMGTTGLHTPRLDQLAEQGTLYSHAYAAANLPGLKPDAALTITEPRQAYSAALELFAKRPRTTVITLGRAIAFANARAVPEAFELPPALPDVAAVREEWRRYLTYVQCLDALAGAALDALERAGLAEDALVLYTSTGGPDARRPLHELAQHVPLIARGPGVAAHSNDANIVSLAGIPQPKPSPFAANENEHGRTIFDGRFRYIRQRNAGQRRPLPAAWEEARASYPAHWAAFAEPIPAEELYDHSSDPGELHNLAPLAAYRQHLARIAKLA